MYHDLCDHFLPVARGPWSIAYNKDNTVMEVTSGVDYKNSWLSPCLYALRSSWACSNNTSLARKPGLFVAITATKDLQSYRPQGSESHSQSSPKAWKRLLPQELGDPVSSLKAEAIGTQGCMITMKPQMLIVPLPRFGTTRYTAAVADTVSESRGNSPFILCYCVCVHTGRV